MAFTGTAVVTMVSDRKVRITGVSLAANTLGTIGLHGSLDSPDVKLPPAFQPDPYRPASNEPIISLQDSIQVSYAEYTYGQDIAPLHITKAGTGDKHFLVTLANLTDLPSPDIEIYVEWH